MSKPPCQRFHGNRFEHLQGQALSPVQLMVLRMLTAGLNSQEVADSLGCSKRAVDQQRQKILAKSGSSSLVQLGAWAERRGYAVLSDFSSSISRPDASYLGNTR